MKLKLFTLAFAFAVVFTGCKKDDEDSTPLDALVGTWVMSKSTNASCTDATDNGTFTCTEDCIEITIKSDGTYVFVSSDEPDELGTITVTATTIKTCTNGEPASSCDTQNYTVSGSKLSVVGTDSDSGCVNTTVLNKK